MNQVPYCGLTRIEPKDAPSFLAARWRGKMPALWTRGGRIDLLDTPLVAMIGTRRPSPRGLDAARQWAAAISRAGATVLSGAAHGIDLACHRGALESGGSTILIPAQGLAQYRAPEEIEASLRPQNHFFISPLDPEESASRHSPLRRNALVAALADVVLVIETPLRSGTAYVIRAMKRRGGPVFALRFVPPIPPSAAGNATLRASGAIMLPERINAESLERLIGRARKEFAARSVQKSSSPADLFDTDP